MWKLSLLLRFAAVQYPQLLNRYMGCESAGLRGVKYFAVVYRWGFNIFIYSQSQKKQHFYGSACKVHCKACTFVKCDFDHLMTARLKL